MTTKAKRKPVEGDLFFIPLLNDIDSFIIVKEGEYKYLCTSKQFPDSHTHNLLGYVGLKYLGNIKDFFVHQADSINANIKDISMDEWDLRLDSGE